MAMDSLESHHSGEPVLYPLSIDPYESLACRLRAANPSVCDVVVAEGGEIGRELKLSLAKVHLKMCT
jgi:hypothetical protein